MKESEKMHLKSTIYESTRAPLTRSPFPDGEGYDTRASLFSHCQSEYTHMWKNNTDGQSLPRVGKVASGASRIGFWRYEKERGNASQVEDKREHPIHRWRGPPFPMGKAAKREYRFSRIVRTNTRICGKTIPTDKAFPNGEGCDTRAPLSPK